MKRTPEQSQETRNALLSAAMEVFLEKGYSDTTIEDIGSRAGVTRGAFYHHYESKPGIYRALLMERYAPAQGIMNRMMSDTTTPPGTLLREVLGEYLRLIASDSQFRQVHELVVLKSAFVPELEEGRAQKIQSQRALVDWLTSLIARGQASGELRKDLDPRDAAMVCQGALSGVVMTELIDPGSARLGKRWRELADLIVRCVARAE